MVNDGSGSNVETIVFRYTNGTMSRRDTPPLCSLASTPALPNLYASPFYAQTLRDLPRSFVHKKSSPWNSYTNRETPQSLVFFSFTRLPEHQDPFPLASTAANTKMLILNDAEVCRVFTVEVAIESQRLAFSGTENVPARLILPTPSGPILFKPASVESSPSSPNSAVHVGLKIVSVRPLNASLSPPQATVPATVLLLDSSTGIVSAVIAGTALTAIRTAAGSALATSLMCRNSSPEALLVFGSGMQGEEHVKAMCFVKPSIRRVVIANRTVSNAQSLIERLQVMLPSVTSFAALSLSDSPSDVSAVSAAVRSSDVICCCTNSSVPLFSGNDLKRDCHINAVGSYTPSMQELDGNTVSRCVIVPDCAGALSTSGDLLSASIAPPLPKTVGGRGSGDGRVPCDLRGLLAGAFVDGGGEQGGGGGEEGGRMMCTLFKSVGVACQDVAAATVVVERARAMGVGIEVPM